MTGAVTVILRAEYKLCISGGGSPRLTWIYALLNEFVVCFV